MERSNRRWAIILLAACLAISDADLATVGAVAGELERHLHISDVQVGLLVSATALVGGVATIPAGALADRLPRVRLMIGSILLWTVAMVIGAASTSYTMLLISRVGLGVVTATTGPVLASLTGDLFAPEERAGVLSRMQSGELAGGALGLVAGGALAGVTSWRVAFLMLSVPALLLAFGMWRKLPEPERGASDEPAGADDGSERPRRLVREAIRSRGIEPDSGLVLREDPARMSLRRAVRYVLSVPTNRVLILASALGYFFFTGVQTFAVVLVEHRFGVSQTAASGLIGVVAIGSVLGVLLGGTIADRRVRSGHLNARMSVAAVCYGAAVLLLIPALLSPFLLIALPFFFFGAGAVTAANPPLDAARLDVVPGLLWGRAEGVRTVLRQLATAVAPTVFGLVSDLLGTHGQVGSVVTGANGTGGDLHDTFLIMLAALAASGLILARGRHRFVTDVATALAASPEREREAAPAPVAGATA